MFVRSKLAAYINTEGRMGDVPEAFRVFLLRGKHEPQPEIFEAVIDLTRPGDGDPFFLKSVICRFPTFGGRAIFFDRMIFTAGKDGDGVIKEKFVHGI
jgi:hypothetical protein